MTNIAPSNIHTALFLARQRIDSTYAKLQNSEAYVFSLEAQLGIEKRWDEQSPEYKKYKEQVVIRDYLNALGELKRLVVMRLFELSKLGMSGTGSSSTFHNKLLTNFVQDTNFVVRLEKHSNVDQKP